MFSQLTTLLRGAPDDLRGWIDNPSSNNLKLCIITIIVGFGSYGFTMGLWRDPLMGGFVSVKMPLMIFITLACNGLLNGMLGLLLGSGLGFRQSLLAQLLSFAVAALILGSLSPVTFFMALNAPPADAPNASSAHANFLVAHTILIACAGVMANLHLARLLLACTPTPRIAGLTLGAWLGGNAFVGAQFSYILRPFFGSPSLKVAFLRDDPMNGTFYESLWSSFDRMSGGNPLAVLLISIAGLLLLLTPLFKILNSNPIKND